MGWVFLLHTSFCFLIISLCFIFLSCYFWVLPRLLVPLCPHPVDQRLLLLLSVLLLLLLQLQTWRPLRHAIQVVPVVIPEAEQPPRRVLVQGFVIVVLAQVVLLLKVKE